MSDEMMCGDKTDIKNASTTTETIPVSNRAHISCGENRFRCKSGTCIWSSWLCDALIDCPNGEDEENCEAHQECGLNSFRCVHSAGCIQTKLVCNGKEECGDGSDEWGCTPNPGTNEPLSCSPFQFLSKTGECIEMYKLCDNKNDCPLGDDETTCSDTAYSFRAHALSIGRNSVNLHSFKIQWKPPIGQPHLEFEYMPAFRDATDLHWRNQSWIEDTSYTFQNLSAGTNYVLTVYTRIKNHSKVVPPTEFLTVTTEWEAPAPPVNVTVSIYHAKHVLVTWRAPINCDGITGYKIYFSPPYPAHFEREMSLKESHEIKFDFVPGVNYTFWVTSLSNELEGSKSGTYVIEFAQDSVVSAVHNLHIVSVTSNTATIAWYPPSDRGRGYTIEYHPDYVEQKLLFSVENTTKETITLKNLAPGANYIARVIALRGAFKGPAEQVTFKTTGTPLPSVTVMQNITVSQDSITLWWDVPKYVTPVKWSYGIHVISPSIHDYEFFDVTTDTNYTLTHLSPCTFYYYQVRVAKPLGFGPSAVGYTLTKFNKLDYPRELTLSYLSSNYMKISWKASCQEIDEEIGYKVLIKDLILNKQHWIGIAPRIDTEISFQYVIHYGGNYSVQVQSDHKNSRPTEPEFFTPPALPTVPEVKALKSKNGTVFVTWEEVKWPKELRGHKFIYNVWLSSDRDMTNALQYNISHPPFFLDSHPFSWDSLYVAVSVMEEHGYPGPLSTEYDLGSDEKSAAVVLTQTSLVGVCVGISVIFILLSGTLVFFVIRHRRLQRSFLSFANSHYDTRSGAATFSTGEDLDEEEEESPMIRGFSDDEPLVIA